MTSITIISPAFCQPIATTAVGSQFKHAMQSAINDNLLHHFCKSHSRKTHVIGSIQYLFLCDLFITIYCTNLFCVKTLDQEESYL